MERDIDYCVYFYFIRCYRVYNCFAMTDGTDYTLQVQLLSVSFHSEHQSKADDPATRFRATDGSYGPSECAADILHCCSL